MIGNESRCKDDPVPKTLVIAIRNFNMVLFRCQIANACPGELNEP
jgi:hypothetical protein